jgi:UDP-N-acetylmuramoylalanine-D-glutamate ligase
LLNLLRDHQDYHTSVEQYWSTKLALFAHQKAGDTAILNLDDAATREPAPQVLAPGGAQVLGVSGHELPTLTGKYLMARAFKMTRWAGL